MDVEEVDAIEPELRSCLGDFSVGSAMIEPRLSCLTVEDPIDGDGPSDNTIWLPESEDDNSLPSATVGICEEASRFCNCEP